MITEIEKPAQIVLIDCQCEKCWIGVMRRPEGVDGMTALMTYPPKYGHVCTHCGHAELYTCIYPRTEVRAILAGQ